MSSIAIHIYLNYSCAVSKYIEDELISDQIQRKKVVIFPDGRMDTKNAAAYLGLSIKTLAMMRCKGTGPRFTKLGGRIFYFQNHLDEYVIKAGFVISTAQARAVMQVNNCG